MFDQVQVRVPESGLVRDWFLGEHTPYSRHWYQKARIRGEGPPFHKLGRRTVVYKWTEVLEWLAAQSGAAVQS